jgi:hypothetical protein
MNKTCEIVLSHATAVAVAVAVLPVAYVAWRDPLIMSNAILGPDDPVIASAALSYVLYTAAVGAALAALTSLRFPTSRRRICAAWGIKAGITELGLLLGFFMVITLAFLQMEWATAPTSRQVLARDARNYLPAITFLTYIAALAWGLFSPSRAAGTRKCLLRLSAVAVSVVMPGVLAVAWFVWRG